MATLYIEQYQSAAFDKGYQIQIPAGYLGLLKVTIPGTSAALDAGTRYVRLMADADAQYSIGNGAVASTATSRWIPGTGIPLDVSTMKNDGSYVVSVVAKA